MTPLLLAPIGGSGSKRTTPPGFGEGCRRRPRRTAPQNLLPVPPLETATITIIQPTVCRTSHRAAGKVWGTALAMQVPGQHVFHVEPTLRCGSCAGQLERAKVVETCPSSLLPYTHIPTTTTPQYLTVICSVLGSLEVQDSVYSGRWLPELFPHSGYTVMSGYRDVGNIQSFATWRWTSDPEAGCCSHLEVWITSTSPSYLAVGRQSMVALKHIPRIFYVKVKLDPGRHSSLRSAWLDSGYMLCVSLGAFWTFAFPT